MRPNDHQSSAMFQHNSLTMSNIQRIASAYSCQPLAFCDALELSEEGVRLREGNAPSGAGGSKGVYQLDTRQEERKPDSFGHPDSMACAIFLTRSLSATD